MNAIFHIVMYVSYFITAITLTYFPPHPVLILLIGVCFGMLGTIIEDLADAAERWLK